MWQRFWKHIIKHYKSIMIQLYTLSPYYSNYMHWLYYSLFFALCQVMTLKIHFCNHSCFFQLLSYTALCQCSYVSLKQWFTMMTKTVMSAFPHTNASNAASPTRALSITTSSFPSYASAMAQLRPVFNFPFQILYVRWQDLILYEK